MPQYFFQTKEKLRIYSALPTIEYNKHFKSIFITRDIRFFNGSHISTICGWTIEMISFTTQQDVLVSLVADLDLTSTSKAFSQTTKIINLHCLHECLHDASEQVRICQGWGQPVNDIRRAIDQRQYKTSLCTCIDHKSQAKYCSSHFVRCLNLATSLVPPSNFFYVCLG